MNIDTLHSTPISAVAGGLMLGAGVTIYLLLNGHITGSSGMLGRLVAWSIRPRPIAPRRSPFSSV